LNLAIKPTRAERAHPADQVGTPDLDGAVAIGQAIVENLTRVLLGGHDAITAAAVAVLSGGHLLIEDVPGVGKTVLARAIAASLGAELSRVQGHPDLLPSDVTGVSVYASDKESWEFRQGPVFAHVVLFDELNRTPPRTQSALLETMEEHQVSVDGESWPLPRPHMVIATQNPRSQRGTFPLVESQLDRFAIATSIGYPDAANEAQMALHEGGKYALACLEPICRPDTWLEAQQATRLVPVSPEVAGYAVEICRPVSESAVGAQPHSVEPRQAFFNQSRGWRRRPWRRQPKRATRASRQLWPRAAGPPSDPKSERFAVSQYAV